MTPIHLRIRELRRAQGWSQEELGKRAEVRQATISRLETEAPTSINLTVLDRIAAALEVEPGFLLVRRPSRTERPSIPKRERQRTT